MIRKDEGRRPRCEGHSPRAKEPGRTESNREFYCKLPGGPRRVTDAQLQGVIIRPNATATQNPRTSAQ